MRLLVGMAAWLALTSGIALAAECQQAKISCSEAKQQNLEYCASDRRAEAGMTEAGCLRSGEKALQECLRTGKWVTGKRNLCGLEKR